MWLVLCEPNDVSAFWAYQGLKTRGLKPLELVSTDMLAHGVRWEHRLGVDGICIDITLADGRSIRSDNICGVFNRLLSVPSEYLLLVQSADRDYVTQELFAFFMSWLYALPQPVLNRPTPQGLSGQWRHISEWLWLASRAGLPTLDYRQSSYDYVYEMGMESRIVPIGTPVNTIIVVGGHVVGASAPPDILRGCQQLAQLARTALLGVDFTAGPAGPWIFAGATPLPVLTLGGQELLDVLALLLKGKQEKKE